MKKNEEKELKNHSLPTIDRDTQKAIMNFFLKTSVPKILKIKNGKSMPIFNERDKA